VEPGMSEEECVLRATEKGFGDTGAHRCDQSSEVGQAETPAEQDWIQRQTASLPQPGVDETEEGKTKNKEQK
jgi:hypothetical protein